MGQFPLAQNFLEKKEKFGKKKEGFGPTKKKKKKWGLNKKGFFAPPWFFFLGAPPNQKRLFSIGKNLFGGVGG